MKEVKRVGSSGWAEVQKVRMDLEKGGGKNEDYDNAEAFENYDF